MRYMFVKKPLSPGNPIANALVVIVGALVIGVSIVLGFFAFLALGAVILVATAFVGARMWWLQRMMRNDSGVNDATARQRSSGGVIEGEFQVIHKDNDEA
ncbi:MAG: hypothetical protein IIA07_07720 [Proteobacteria bacterium]|nr:hypothetical protein [Pseudomonadota bacterium]